MARPEPPESWADLPFFSTHWPALWDRLAAAPGWQPEPQAIFRALALTARPRVRVVILGQDPYHTPGRATGLAFSFPPGTPPRDSLRNILTEVASDTGRPKADGDLTAWAGQGVLLLNTALTVPVGQANGHKSLGWQPLVHDILQATARLCPLGQSGAETLRCPAARWPPFPDQPTSLAALGPSRLFRLPPLQRRQPLADRPGPARNRLERLTRASHRRPGALDRNLKPPAIHLGPNIPRGSGGVKPPVPQLPPETP